MSSNVDNERSSTTGKMYPIDLASPKITIVKSVPNTDVKMAHLISGQTKNQISTPLGSHSSSGAGLMRSGLAQIISSNTSSQPQMIISGSSILQGSQIGSQGSQILSQSSQILSQSQIITPSGQLLSPGTQIISQGTQLSVQVSTNASSSVQTSVASTSTGAQTLNVGSLLGSGASNLVVNSSIRTMPPTVRVLPPPPHHNTRPAGIQMSNVNVSSASSVLVNKGVSVGVTSHVPRGLAAGASLALRPVAPGCASQNTSNQGGAWGGSRPARGALVYGARARGPAPAPVSAHQPHSTVLTLATPTVLNSTSSVISGGVRSASPRGPPPAAAPPAPRPLPLLQRNYQPAKVVGVSAVGARGAVGNSAPAQLYYEVPRPTPYASIHTQQPVNIVNATVTPLPENRQIPSSVQTTPIQARPTILRKRDADGSPSKGSFRSGEWEDVCGGEAGSGGSTTMSASSSPPPEDEPRSPPEPRKKPRKQLLNNDARACEFPTVETPHSPPPITIIPPPKRPLLSGSFVCGWRGTALHFVRPGDVRRREPAPRDIVAIAAQRHVLTSADGWKVHHLTAQMDDLMSLESDVGSQLSGLLRALESASGKALSALQPHSHTLLELLKGNIQRSKIVCEGIQEAREDILRVFTHRKSVSDILTRQADKRCFRKHRSQS